MKKNVNVAMVMVYVVIGLIGAAAIACLIISIVTGKTTPYLAMGLGLGAVGNIMGLIINLMKKGKNNGSGKDRSIS